MVTSILKPLYLLRLFPIFDEATKLCENRGGFCKAFLNEWVSENVASEVDDFEFIDKKRANTMTTKFKTHLIVQAVCIYIG